MSKPWQIAVWWVVSGSAIWSGSGLLYWWCCRNDPPGSYAASDSLVLLLMLGLSGTGIAHSILISRWRGGGFVWMLSTVTGFVLGEILVANLADMLSFNGSRSSEDMLFVALGSGIGILISGLQWLFAVRGWGRSLWWWVIAGGVGWANAWVVLYGAPPLMVPLRYRPIEEASLLVSGMGVLHGLIAGAAIYRIARTLQRQAAPANALRATDSESQHAAP